MADPRAGVPGSDKERVVPDEIDRLFSGSPGFHPLKDSIGKRMKPPRVLHMEVPEYPVLAQTPTRPVRVTLAALVDKDGTLLETKVLRSTDSRFNNGAIVALGRWKFSVGTTDGAPDTFVMVVPFVFITPW